MFKKVLTYGIILHKLSQLRHLLHLGKYYDRRLLWLLLIPPAYLLVHRTMKSNKKVIYRPLPAALLGIAAGQLELMRLRAKTMLQE